MEHVLSYVLKSVSSDFIEGKANPSLPEPTFIQDSEAWNFAFQTVQELDVALPFFLNVRNSIWWRRLPDMIRLRMQAGIEREKMLQSVFDVELEKVLSNLIEARQTVMLINGMDTGRRLYPARWYRPVQQVDIMIPKDGVDEVMRVLGLKGFRMEKPIGDHGFVLKNSRQSQQVLLNLYYKLHALQPDVSMAAVWDRAVEGQLPGLVRLVKAPAAEDCLAYLIHCGVYQNLLPSPKWLNDFRLVIDQNPNLDWEQVLRTSHDEKFVCATWFALRILDREWGCKIPAEVLTEIRGKIGHWRRRRLDRNGRGTKWFKSGQHHSAGLLRDNLFSQI